MILLYILIKNKLIYIYIYIKPLDYWKSNAFRFSYLALIARKYLGIPASSAPNERFFSQGTLVIIK